MKYLHLPLIALALSFPLGAEEYVTNGNFLQGTKGWKGNFKAVEQAPGTPAPKPGLTIPLQPHEWTWLSQDIDTKHQRMKFSINYEFSADAAFSTDLLEYQVVGPKIGIPFWKFTLSKAGDVAILETGNVKRHSMNFFLPKFGGPNAVEIQTKSHSADYYQQQEMPETVTIGFPPGTGSVTISQISATDIPVDPNAKKESMLSRTPDVEYLQNGEFIQGAQGWGGNFELTSPTPVPGSIVVRLKRNDWTTLTQDIDIKGARFLLYCNYIVSPGATYSTDPKDYEDLAKKVGLPDWSEAIQALTAQAGGSLQGKAFVVLTGQDKTENETFLISPDWSKTSPDGKSNSFTFSGQDNKRKFLLALPPGTGTVRLIAVTGKGSTSDTNPQLAAAPAPPAPTPPTAAAPSPTANPPATNSANTAPPASSSPPGNAATSPPKAIRRGFFSFNALNYTHGDWGGNFHAVGLSPNTAPPPATNSGVLIELKPHEWTTFSKDAVMGSAEVELRIQFSATDVTVSTDPADYANVGNQIGLTQPGEEIEALLKQAQGSFQGKCLAFFTGEDKAQFDGFVYDAHWGPDGKRLQNASHTFNFGAPNAKRKVTIALPPGSGTVIMNTIAGSGVTDSGWFRPTPGSHPPSAQQSATPPAGVPQIAGLIEDKTGKEIPALPKEDLIKNGDFRNGLSYWKGDLNSYASMIEIGKTNLPPSPPQGTGAYLELRNGHWLKFSQEIKVTTPSIVVNVVYAFSTDLKFSQYPSDYGNLEEQTGVIGATSCQPGRWAIFCHDFEKNWPTMAFPPATSPDEPGIRQASFRMDGKGDASGRREILIAFPPGKGTVTIYRISAEPSTLQTY